MSNKKFIRVQDAPIVSVSVPVVDNSSRIFQLADSSNEIWIDALDYGPFTVQRLIIPVDNSEGSTPLGVFLTGHFIFDVQVTQGEGFAIHNETKTYWSDLDPDSQGMNVQVNTNNEKTTSITTEETGNAGDGSMTVSDQVSFVASGVLAAGETERLLYTDLVMTKIFSTAATELWVHGIGMWAQGTVRGGVESPWPESFEADPDGLGEEVGSKIWTTGEPNYGVNFSRYWLNGF